MQHNEYMSQQLFSQLLPSGLAANIERISNAERANIVNRNQLEGKGGSYI
jgi:hypothetical protein